MKRHTDALFAKSEIPCSAFPRFQHLNLLHGVLSSTLSPSFIREYRLTTPDTTAQSPSSFASNNPSSANSSTVGTNPNSNSNSSNPNSTPLQQVHIGYLLRADEAVWSSRFSSGTKVDLIGTLTVHLIFKDLGNGQPVLRVESFEFESRGHEEWVVREAMEVIGGNIGNGNLPLSAPPPPSTPGGNGNGSGDNKKDSTTTTMKEENESSPEKGANEGTSRSRRSSNSTNGGGRKGMTTRRRSASAREEQETDQDENESGSQQEKRDNVKKDSSADDGGGASLHRSASSAGSREGGNEQAQQRRAGPTARIPASSVGSFGVTEMGMRCLEVSDEQLLTTLSRS